MKRMKVLKFDSNDALSMKAADIITDTLHTTENPVLGLATGSTPERLYEILIERCQSGEITFEHTSTFNLDEYVGLAADDINSYRYFMNQNLFNRIDVKIENTHIPDGTAEDLDAVCEAYEAEMEKAGHVDVQILGLGLNGHIAFNEPGTSFDIRTHVVTLDEMTRESNARFFDEMEDVPTHAITMGIDSIMDAKKIILLVTGEKKADILRQVVEGNITKDVPASILQNHPDVTVITDIDL